MKIIDFFDSIDDFRSFAPGVEGSLFLDSLYPSFLSTRNKIQEVISKEVYDALLADYEKPTKEHNIAIEAIKSAIANYTMFKYAIFDAISKNSGEQKLYKYQLEAIKEEYISLFWASMDEVLRYLEKNHKVGDWESSAQYKLRKNLVIKDSREFDNYFGIENSPYFFSKIQFLIRKIYQDQILPRIGGDFSQIDDKLKDKCKRAVCSHVMAEAVMLFDITELPKSIRNDVAHEFTKTGSAVQVREKLSSMIMSDVTTYYLDIERALSAKKGVTNAVNHNKESDKTYFMS